ncbi:MAG: alpha/beta fold hydrolase [Colwellia sp.]
MALLNYQQMGQGEHLILIHGLFGSLENLNMVAKPLSQYYCVTSVDVRNHGNSFHKSDMNYSALAQDIFKLTDKLNIKNCAILGHSMGGKIAIQTALNYPERIKKLIIADIAPVNYPPHHLHIIEGLQAIDVNQIKSRKEADKQFANYVDNTGVRQFLLRNLFADESGKFNFKCNIKYISDCYSQIMQANDTTNTASKAESHQFTGQTLFIKGGNSDYILPEHKSAIAKILPNSKAKIIQGAGHWLHAEKTTVFNRIVMDFLAK